MHATCPDCETELDETTGICPACRWDPILSLGPFAGQFDRAALVDRYGSDELDPMWSFSAPRSSTPVSRTRLLVLVGLLGVAAIYAVVLTMLGMV